MSTISGDGVLLSGFVREGLSATGAVPTDSLVRLRGAAIKV